MIALFAKESDERPLSSPHSLQNPHNRPAISQIASSNSWQNSFTPPRIINSGSQTEEGPAHPPGPLYFRAARDQAQIVTPLSGIL